MELIRLILILGFGLIHAVWSSPIEARKPSSHECLIVDEIVFLLKLTGATPFCSSFLHIPVVTSVSTISKSTTVVVTTSPRTVSTTTLYTSTETEVVSTTSTTTTLASVVTTVVVSSGVATAFVTSTSTLFTALPKRDVPQERRIELPGFLQNFESAAISTACSCISIPQSTHKTTTTTVSTLLATATSSITQTISAATTTTTTTTILTNLIVPTSASTNVKSTTTETVVVVATDCPQAIQDPGFEGPRNPPEWQAVTDISQGTYSEVYSDVPIYTHTGQNCFIFPFLNDPGEGSIIFSLTQTTAICPHQRLTLGFWLRVDAFEPSLSCSMQVCMASQCQVFSVLQGSPSHDNQYLHYSFLGPVPDGSTTMKISVSTDGGSKGSCFGSIAYFDDFTLE